MTDPRELLHDAYGRVGESVPAVLDGLTPEDVAWQPEGRGNSIGWLIWHLTRVLDDHLAGVAGTNQVIESGDWAARLGLDRPALDTGYGDSADDVAGTRFADVGALAGYHAAVQQMAASAVDGVSDLDAIVDDRWDPPVTAATRLVSVADDLARHIGQAEFVRGILNEM